MLTLETERIRSLLGGDLTEAERSDLERHHIPRALLWLRERLGAETPTGDRLEIAADAAAWYALHLLLLTQPTGLQWATADLKVSGDSPLTAETARRNAHENLSRLGIPTSRPVLMALG